MCFSGAIPTIRVFLGHPLQHWDTLYKPDIILLDMEMKFMPQMMDQTQPTMMAKVMTCSRAATRFRQKALPGRSSLVRHPHRQVKAEKNVPVEGEG